MIRLYRFALSGHSHRAELFLSLLGQPFEGIDVDLAKGEQRRPEFLAKNVFGQVPVLEDGEVTVADSNAILVYLASRYDRDGRWLPRDAAGAAAVQRWLSVAAGPLFNGPCAARLVRVFGSDYDHARAVATAARLYQLLDGELAQRSFLVGDHATLADVALYSYSAAAHEGGVSLAPYDHVRAWLRRIEALPGFVAMPPAPHAATA